MISSPIRFLPKSNGRERVPAVDFFSLAREVLASDTNVARAPPENERPSRPEAVRDPAKFLILQKKKFFEIFLNFCDYCFRSQSKNQKSLLYY
jgi:hypothetical protein